MREILFRGKRVDNGEWVEGFLCKTYSKNPPHTRTGIMHQTEYDAKRWLPDYLTAEVEIETVGQYTGLTDKNGTRIFEGDICKSIDGVFLIFFDKDLCGFSMQFLDCMNEILDMREMWDDSEIIGNVWDNPELLESEG